MEIEYIVALEGGLGAQPKRPPAEIIAFAGNAPHAAFIAPFHMGYMISRGEGLPINDVQALYPFGMKVWHEIERGRGDDVSSLRRIATPVLLFAILLFTALGIMHLFAP
jgi:hypothetical protein